MLVCAHPSELTDLVGQSLIEQYCAQLTAHDTQQTTVFIRGSNGGNPEPSSTSVIQAQIVSHDISFTVRYSELVGMYESKSGDCYLTVAFGEIFLSKNFPAICRMGNGHASLEKQPVQNMYSLHWTGLNVYMFYSSLFMNEWLLIAISSPR